jgi:hypothetical protein
MFSVREILKLSGVRSIRDEVLGEVHRCPRHTTGSEPTLRPIFVGSSIPYFQCHKCGTTLDPISMLASATQKSLKAAADILAERPHAFHGTDITPFLEQAERTQKWSSFFKLNRGDYQDTVRSNRLITDPRTLTTSLLYDRCLIKLVDFIQEFPELRKFISLGTRVRKQLIVQMNYNAAGAPGQIQIMSPQGALLHEIYLDHQTEANHLYLATPHAMLRKSWLEHLAIFNSHEEAAKIWDWMMEWMEKSDANVPVVAVASMRGKPDKANIRRMTIMPVRMETAWAGAGFAPGFTRVSVKRITKDSLRHLSAKEVFFALDSRQAWGNLPTILADFAKVSRTLLDVGDMSLFRSFLEETMSLDHLTVDEKNMAIESLGQQATEKQKRFMDDIVDVVCYSAPLKLLTKSYLVLNGCYIKEVKSTRVRSQVTDFRSRIVLRLETEQLRPGGRSRQGGTINILKTTNDDGESVFCMVNDVTMGSTAKLMEILRNSFARQGMRMVNVYGREPLLGQVIEGTQGDLMELARFPCLGFDHGSLSYNYLETSFTPEGKRQRQLICREATEWVNSQVMMPAKGTTKGLLDAVSYHETAKHQPTVNALAKAIAISCMFAFRSARSRHGFHLLIEQPRLLKLVAVVAGLKTLGPPELRELKDLPLYLDCVPCVLEDVHSRRQASFKFRICAESPFDIGRPDFRIKDGVPGISNLTIDSLPVNTFSLFAEAALSCTTVEATARAILNGASPSFISTVLGELNDLVSNDRSELDVLRDYILSSDHRDTLVAEVPGHPDMLAIRKDVVDACFGSTGDHQPTKRAINSALKRTLGVGNVSSRKLKLWGASKRVHIWCVPVSFLEGNKIIKLA